MNPNKNILLEIFAVVIIIIILTTAFFFRFHDIKVGVRNNSREGSIAEIQKALLFYKNKNGNFPVSPEGECITDSQKVTKELQSLSAIRKIPEDPVWPDTEPAELTDDHIPAEGTVNFCYWYVSPQGNNYHLSYYMDPHDKNNDTKEGVVTISNKPKR